jgi:membrane-associated protein
MIESLIPLFLNLDQNLMSVVNEYGIWTYVILFFIIFLETGFVIFPFLPGDSLLFVSGAAAASGIMDLWWVIIAIVLGAVLGDTVNYWIGNFLGLHVFLERFPTLVKREYIDRTYVFYDKYGGLTIFVARFVPVVRTFAPFLAGIGSMNYKRFLFYNVLGAVSWTLLFVIGGYFFGTFTIVKENMNVLIFLVFVVTGIALFLLLAGIASARLKKGKELPKNKE